MLRQERLSASAAVRRYERPCTPPLWARGGHAQTLLAHLLPSGGERVSRATHASREVALADGERLVVHETGGTSDARVILMHGLSGDANADYVRVAREALAARGHATWSVNHRGCGEGEGLAGKPYHSGKTEDLRDVLLESRADAPHLLHVVVGFSLSANIALLAAGRRDPVQPDAIVAVNPPVDLLRASRDIHRGWNRLYELRFSVRLARAVRARVRAGLATRDYRVPFGASLMEFDDLYTAPEGGFADGMDYYRRCSSLPVLDGVRVPAVWLTSGDDPFVRPDGFAEAPRSSDVCLHLEPVGGHVGYLERRGAGYGSWLSGAIPHYVDELLRVARERREETS